MEVLFFCLFAGKKAVIGRVARPRIVQTTTSTRTSFVWPNPAYGSSPSTTPASRSIGSLAKTRSTSAGVVSWRAICALFTSFQSNINSPATAISIHTSYVSLETRNRSSGRGRIGAGRVAAITGRAPTAEDFGEDCLNRRGLKARRHFHFNACTGDGGGESG